MTLYRLDASIRVDGSESRKIADIVEHEWRGARPDDEILRRHVGRDPIPATQWASAVEANFVVADQRTAAQTDALAQATAEADDLIAADAVLFAVPLYNYGGSQHFKAWADLVLQEPRTAFGNPDPEIKGKPAVLVTVRGGSYAPGTPREGWDHATPWMRRILEDVWQLDLTVVEAEFMLVGINPALDEFADLAKHLRAEADGHARTAGRRIAGRTATASPRA